ncbi:hypothetical protein PO550_14260, partial [Escherichia coli]
MERGTASGGASLLKEFHPVQTLQQVENYTALSERASEYLLAVIRSKPDAVICLATGATPLLTYHYLGNDSNLLIVFYVQIMPDDFVMQLHR